MFAKLQMCRIRHKSTAFSGLLLVSCAAYGADYAGRMRSGVAQRRRFRAPSTWPGKTPCRLPIRLTSTRRRHGATASLPTPLSGERRHQWCASGRGPPSGTGASGAVIGRRYLCRGQLLGGRAAWANGVAARELDSHDTFLAADYSHLGGQHTPTGGGRPAADVCGGS